MPCIIALPYEARGKAQQWCAPQGHAELCCMVSVIAETYSSGLMGSWKELRQDGGAVTRVCRWAARWWGCHPSVRMGSFAV